MIFGYIFGYIIGSFVTGVAMIVHHHFKAKRLAKTAFILGQHSITSLTAALHEAQQTFNAMRETAALTNLN